MAGEVEGAGGERAIAFTAAAEAGGGVRGARDPSGRARVAPPDPAHESLQRQSGERSAERRYLAVVRGAPKFEIAEVDASIGRHPVDRKRMAVLPSTAQPPPRRAQTELK